MMEKCQGSDINGRMSETSATEDGWHFRRIIKWLSSILLFLVLLWLATYSSVIWRAAELAADSDARLAIKPQFINSISVTDYSSYEQVDNGYATFRVPDHENYQLSYSEDGFILYHSDSLDIAFVVPDKFIIETLLDLFETMEHRMAKGNYAGVSHHFRNKESGESGSGASMYDFHSLLGDSVPLTFTELLMLGPDGVQDYLLQRSLKSVLLSSHTYQYDAIFLFENEHSVGVITSLGRQLHIYLSSRDRKTHQEMVYIPARAERFPSETLKVFLTSYRFRAEACCLSYESVVQIAKDKGFIPARKNKVEAE